MQERGLKNIHGTFGKYIGLRIFGSFPGYVNHIFSLAEMASRYIARRYGEQTGNRSRASSVVSESTSRASSQVN